MRDAGGSSLTTAAGRDTINLASGNLRCCRSEKGHCENDLLGICGLIFNHFV